MLRLDQLIDQRFGKPRQVLCARERRIEGLREILAVAMLRPREQLDDRFKRRLEDSGVAARKHMGVE